MASGVEVPMRAGCVCGGGLGWGEGVMGRYVGVYHVDVNDRRR